MEPKKTRRGKKDATEAFLAAYVCGATIETAADKAGISKSTAQRRLKDPEVRNRLAELKAEMLRRSSGLLTAANLEAIKTLLELLKPPTDASVRARVATDILKLSMRLREHAELPELIAALTERLQVVQSKNAPSS